MLHNKENPGVADIRPGRTINAKVAFSPAGATNVAWAGEFLINFTGEYQGVGYGNLVVETEIREDETESGAFNSLKTTLGNSAAALLALAYISSF